MRKTLLYYKLWRLWGVAYLLVFEIKNSTATYSSPGGSLCFSINGYATRPVELGFRIEL